MKKIFIIAPHFPPSALPPAQRVRLLVKHLHSFGYYPYVFTSNPKYREENVDPWMSELAGDDYKLEIVKTLNPDVTRKIGIGDLGLRMLPFLYKKIKLRAKEINPDFILYLVPPWYLLLIAKRIRKKTGIPYGIDFIDPWVVPKTKNDSLKKKISQVVARKYEKRAVFNADIVYSVSEGINEKLRKFHKLNPNKKMYAIPYGVEPSDFAIPVKKNENKKIVFRYIGALWHNAYPVVEALLKALSNVEKTVPLSVEFYGTSYAGEKHAKSQTITWINEFNMGSYMNETPLRVSYKKAVELTLTADILLLFGGMEPYYAASKLMGMVASGKPFFAFLHNDSFPAKFLKELNYPYLVTYSEEDLPKTKSEKIEKTLIEIISKKDNFVKFNLDHPLIKENTAFGMTEKFISPIKELLKKNND